MNGSAEQVLAPRPGLRSMQWSKQIDIVTGGGWTAPSHLLPSEPDPRVRAHEPPQHRHGYLPVTLAVATSPAAELQNWSLDPDIPAIRDPSAPPAAGRSDEYLQPIVLQVTGARCMVHPQVTSPVRSPVLSPQASSFKVDVISETEVPLVAHASREKRGRTRRRPFVSSEASTLESSSTSCKLQLASLPT